MSASTVDWAVKYIQMFGFRLVPIPRGLKGPVGNGWNTPGRYIEDVEKAKVRWGNGSDEGIGVVLGPSGVCSIDIDFAEHAERALGELGIDLRKLRQGVPTVVGNPKNYRLLFQVPPGVGLSRKVLTWPARKAGEKPSTIFELRGGDVQDVLPPTRHPKFPTPYVWQVPPDGGFPPLPEILLELWVHWGTYKLELEGLCPWGKGFTPKEASRGPGAKVNVISAYNAAHSVEGLLERSEYTRKGKRWLSPTSSTKLAGVVVLDDGKAFSHHGSDPLADGHSHDAFDLYRIFEHAGDTKAAVKAACEELGIGLGANKSRSGGEDEVVYRRVSDIKSKPIRWLWPGRIARGKVLLLAGHPGLGKSQLTCSVASISTTGGSWPVDRTQSDRGSVIVLSAEDDAEDTIRPRLEAAGADLTRVYILDAVRVPDGDGATTRMFDLTADIGRLGDLADRVGDVALIVIDPVTAYMGGVDSHKNSEVRGVLAPLAAMASEKGIAIVCVTHLTKGGVGMEVLLRVIGSLAFVGAARGAYLVAKDPDDETRRLFLPMKNNLAAEDLGGLAYRVKGRDLGGGIKTSCVEWDADGVTMTADEAMAPAEDPDPGDEAKATDAAVDWLRELLLYSSVDSKEVSSGAKQSGFSWRTIERAKARLGVKSTRAGFAGEGKWRWSLPLHIVPKDEEAPSTHSDVGGLWETTTIKPSSDAGSTIDRQGPKGPSPPTTIKPSSDAGSTIDRQGFGENETVGGLCSNPSVARVPGGTEDLGAEGLGGLSSNQAGTRVPGDQNSIDRQGVECVGENDGGDPLYRDVVITIDHGKGSHRSFPAHDPEGRTLEAWRAKVLAVHGTGATVRPAPQ